MRDKFKPASLGELMGDGYEYRTELTLDDLPDLLGEKTPEIKYDRVGKLRLVNALQNRFGDGFRNIPGIQQLLNQFDQEIKTESLVKLNRRR